MTDIASRMRAIADALPSKSEFKRGPMRDVCLTLDSDGTWSVMAGGHPAVHIGEWGGDYSGSALTPEGALAIIEDILKISG